MNAQSGHARQRVHSSCNDFQQLITPFHDSKPASSVPANASRISVTNETSSSCDDMLRWRSAARDRIRCRPRVCSAFSVPLSFLTTIRPTPKDGSLWRGHVVQNFKNALMCNEATVRMKGRHPALVRDLFLCSISCCILS